MANEILQNAMPFHVDDKRVSNENYTLSLLQICSAEKLLSESCLAGIRQALDNAFTEAACQYTKRRSSSIREETARQLYASVLYQCDCCLKSFNSADKAVEVLMNMPPENIIAHGRALIMKAYREAAVFYNRGKENELNFNLPEYRYSMDKGFDDFMASYSARFAASDSCISLDYPLMNTKPYESELHGVMFVRDYYKCLMLENKFCAMFDSDELYFLAVGVGKMYGCAWNELLFNIAAAAAQNFIIRLMLKKTGFELKLEKADIAELSAEYGKMPQEEFVKAACSSLRLCRELYADPQLIVYLKTFATDFGKRLYIHVGNNNADKLAVLVDGDEGILAPKDNSDIFE